MDDQGTPEILYKETETLRQISEVQTNKNEKEYKA